MKKAAEEYELALFRRLRRTDLYNKALESPLTKKGGQLNMMEINGVHLLIAVAALFVFIAARSVQWMAIAVRWRVPLSQLLMVQMLRKKRSAFFKFLIMP